MKKVTSITVSHVWIDGVEVPLTRKERLSPGDTLSVLETRFRLELVPGPMPAPSPVPSNVTRANEEHR